MKQLDRQRLLSITLTGAFLFVTLAPSARGGDGVPASGLHFDPELTSVRQLMKEKRYSEAKAPLDEFLKRKPNSILGLIYRSKCLTDANKYREAIQDLKSAQNLDPKCAVVYRAEADIYAMMKQYDNSISAATEAIKYSKVRPDKDIFHTRSMMYSAIGQHKRAIQDMDSYLKIDPVKPRAYSWRATACEQDGQLDRAIGDYRTAFQKSNSYEYQFHIARILQKQGKLKEAIEEVSKIIKQNPGEDEAWNRRGMLYCKIGKYQEAVSDYTKALETNFGSEETLYRSRARAYEKLGKRDLADKDFKKADELRNKPTVAPI